MLVGVGDKAVRTINSIAVAENVKSEQNTLSPGFTPANFTAKCKLAVPLMVDIQSSYRWSDGH